MRQTGNHSGVRKDTRYKIKVESQNHGKKEHRLFFRIQDLEFVIRNSNPDS